MSVSVNVAAVPVVAAARGVNETTVLRLLTAVLLAVNRMVTGGSCCILWKLLLLFVLAVPSSVDCLLLPVDNPDVLLTVSAWAGIHHYSCVQPKDRIFRSSLSWFVSCVPHYV